MTSVSSRPAKLQWNIVAGDDVAVTLTFVDAAGTAVDMTGTYAASVLDSSLAAVQTIAVDDTDAATGVLVLSMADTVTELLTGSLYFWKLTSASPDTTWLDGPMSVGQPGQAGLGSGSGSATVVVSQAADVTVTATSGGTVATGGSGGGAPTDATYLVTTANGTLSAEVVVGATPGGELGGTWASPTVDATHSGSSHASVQAAAEATAANADNLTSGTVADARIASTIARDSEVTAAVSAHEADTTSVHGITDTSVLETTTGAQSKADAKVDDTAYNATSWDAVTTVAPSKNAVRDKVETLAPLASPTFTGSPVVPGYLPLLAAGAAVENIGAVESNVNTVATTGSTETLDTSVYGVHDCTMDQNCTFTFSNPAPSGKNTTFVLILRGAFTPTLPASVKWSSGSVPTYTTPSVYVFTTVDAGTTYYAQQVGRAFA